jgi:tetratricopeptide (TPR) repeat protein
MPTLYFSLCSSDSEPLVQRLVNECESYMEGKCIVEKGGKSFTPEKIRDRLASCDALIVVIGGDKEIVLSERIRVEIVSAINLNLMIVPLFLDSAISPERRSVRGALKRLLEYKTYRLRSGFWFEDLHQFLEDIEEELEFKREVEKKLSQSFRFNFQDRGEYTGEFPKTPKLDLSSCGPSGLNRVIDSENLNLADAQRKGNRTGEKEALSALGLVYARLGQTQKAIQYFQKQLEIVREMGNATEKCGLLANLGDAFAISGNIEQARTYYQEQLFLAESGDYRAFIGSAYNGLGFVYVKQDKIVRGIECYLKALAIYRELEDHDKELELLVGIGLNYRKLGELNQTIEFFEKALKNSRYLENRKEEAQILVDLGEIHFQLGNIERVEFYLPKAENFLKTIDGPLAETLSIRLKNLRESLSRAE